MTVSSEDVLNRLDRAAASPEVRARVAHELLRCTNYRDELVNEAFREYASGFSHEDSLLDLRKRLLEAREKTDDAQFYLAWGMLPSDDQLDGYLAEFYFEWAEALGIGENTASLLFLRIMQD